MKTAIKTLAGCALTASPIYWVLRAHALRYNPTAILCYHTLRADHENLDSWLALRMSDFSQQVDRLCKTHDIISLDEAMEPASPGARPRAVLTFDDGEWGLHEYLLPFVESNHVPVTIYVGTGQIETGQPYWFDRVMNALQGSGATLIDMQAAELPTWTVGPARGAERWSVISNILEALKNAPPEDRARLADDVIAQTGTPEPGFTPLAPITLPQLKELAASPYVTIGAHSHCHSLLDQISLLDASASIEQSRTLLQKWTGQPVRHFAYPNGNYTTYLMAEIKDLGFASASILDMKLAGPECDPFALSRIGIGRYDSLQRFILRLVNT